MAATPTPFQAFQHVRDLNPYNKHSSSIPKRKEDPKGTGSFKRFVLNIAYLVDLLGDQCLSDPWMLAIASIDALTAAAYEIIEPDIKEAYHVVTGHSLVCSLKQEIKDGKSLGSSFYDGAKKTLFRTAELADGIVWKLFLYSVLADGLIEAEYLAQNLAGCGDQTPSSSHTPEGATADHTNIGSANGFAWLTGNPIYPAFGATVTIGPGESGYIIWCGSGTDLNGVPVPLIFNLVETVTGRVVREAASIPDTRGGYHHIIQHYAMTNRTTETVILEVKAWSPQTVSHHVVLPGPGFCAHRPFNP